MFLSKFGKQKDRRDINSIKYENKGTERKDKERAGRKIKSSPKLLVSKSG